MYVEPTDVRSGARPVPSDSEPKAWQPPHAAFLNSSRPCAQSRPVPRSFTPGSRSSIFHSLENGCDGSALADAGFCGSGQSPELARTPIAAAMSPIVVMAVTRGNHRRDPSMRHFQAACAAARLRVGNDETTSVAARPRRRRRRLATVRHLGGVMSDRLSCSTARAHAGVRVSRRGAGVEARSCRRPRAGAAAARTWAQAEQAALAAEPHRVCRHRWL